LSSFDYRSLIRVIVHLSALEHLHDLLHDLRVHALSLLQLLAITVNDGGGGLGDAEVLLG
jgi:ABC-type methionine transport system permease subunit